jgi:hypothetical protein
MTKQQIARFSGILDGLESVKVVTRTMFDSALVAARALVGDRTKWLEAIYVYEPDVK